MYPQYQCTTYPANVEQTFTELQSTSEELAALRRRIVQLESQITEEKRSHAREVENIKRNHAIEMEALRAKHEQEIHQEQRSQRSFPFDGCDITPGKVRFMQHLTTRMQSALENEDENGGTSSFLTCQKRLRLQESAVQEIFPTSDDVHMLSSPGAQSDMPPAGSLQSPSSVHMLSSPGAQSDMPPALCLQSPSSLIPLVEDIEDVLITRENSSSCLLKADGKPELLVRELLLNYFTQEELARSCALGSRTAHNAKSQSTALNTRIMQAIKRFVLLKFRQPSGQPILKDREFHAIINSKCATARRSLARFQK